MPNPEQTAKGMIVSFDSDFFKKFPTEGLDKAEVNIKGKCVTILFSRKIE